MEFDKLLDKREADSGAFVGAPPCSLHAMKTLKKPRKLVIRNTGASVTHFQFRRSPIGGGAKRNPNFSLERELISIRQKIENDFLPHVVINEDVLRQAFAMNFETKAGSLHGGAKGRCKVFG